MGEKEDSRLARRLGLMGLIATGVCTVIGGGINVLTVMIQKEIPGICSQVPSAFFLGAIPAIFCALSFGILASAMPLTGGTYIYISRGMSPFLGFISTFSQWLGLTAAIGVIAYAKMFLLVDAFHQIESADAIERVLRGDLCMIGIPLAVVWLSWLLNILGIKAYERVMITFMFLMLSGGAVLIFTGLTTSHEEFTEALLVREGIRLEDQTMTIPSAGLTGILRAASVLFFAYLGFDAISQAGDESKKASVNLPLAFILSAAVIIIYYTLFSIAVYHSVPWQYVLYKAVNGKITAPGLMSVLWSPGLAIFVILMAAVALANDVPPLQMATSRLLYAWTLDKIFPGGLGKIGKRFRVPYRSVTLGSVVASMVIIECHLHGFFLGVDLATMALLFTYLLVGWTVLILPYRNPDLHKAAKFIKNKKLQIISSAGTVIFTFSMLFIIVEKDPLWQGKVLHSSFLLWIISLGCGVFIFYYYWSRKLA
jgi:APA family basic amino acid/polyamine antiporter